MYFTPSDTASSVPAVDREQHIARLTEAGKRRRRAMDAKRKASEEIAAMIPAAHRAGVGVSEIAKLTGMSRRAVYDILGENE